MPMPLRASHKVSIVIATLLFAATAAVPHFIWERLSPMFYVLSIAALVGVLVIGSSAGGATRWLTVCQASLPTTTRRRPPVVRT